MGAPRDPPCPLRPRTGAHLPARRSRPARRRPGLPPSSATGQSRVGPSLPNEPGRPRYGPGHWGVSPASPAHRDTAPRPAPSRLFIAVLGSGFCLGSQSPDSAPREGVNAFHQPATFARAGAPCSGERGTEKGRRGSWRWLWPEH